MEYWGVYNVIFLSMRRGWDVFGDFWMLIKFICDFVVDSEVEFVSGFEDLGWLIEVFVFWNVVCDREFCFFKMLVNLFVKFVLLRVRGLIY